MQRQVSSNVGEVIREGASTAGETVPPLGLGVERDTAARKQTPIVGIDLHKAGRAVERPLDGTGIHGRHFVVPSRVLGLEPRGQLAAVPRLLASAADSAPRSTRA